MVKSTDLKVAQSCLTLCDLTDCSPPRSSVHTDSPGTNTGVGTYIFPSPGDLSNPRIKPRSPMLQADSLLSEPPQKPSETALNLLQTLSSQHQ